MALSNSELMTKLNKFPDVSLTLANDKSEVYHAGELRTLKHTKNTVTLRWAVDEPFNNAHPLTYAILHRGNKLWSVIGIKPIHNGVEGSEIELAYNY